MLDEAATGPRWLEIQSVAECVRDAILFAEKELRLYELRAWVIMVNHVHLLIYPKAELPRITRAIKNYSARQANAILGRTGPFWQDESYDHWVRNAGEMEKTVAYIEGNPVAAGLVARVEEWKWSSAFGVGRRPVSLNTVK